MMDSPDFQNAGKNDLEEIRALLRNAGLPFEDITGRSMPDFIVLRRAGELLAAGGIERYGDDGLLRSIVVNEAARGTGLGARITAAIENRARESDIGTLYLLTTTAAEFFPRLGYQRFERTAVPEAVARSAEFASICPASAVCMKKNLE